MMRHAPIAPWSCLPCLLGRPSHVKSLAVSATWQRERVVAVTRSSLGGSSGVGVMQAPPKKAAVGKAKAEADEAKKSEGVHPKLKHKQGSSSSPAAPGPPPRKPRSAADHYVLECFKKISEDDEPVDLGELPEQRLRTIVRLVSQDPDFDEGMNRGELLAAAGDLLAREGNAIRFKKSLVQIEAKERWKNFTDEQRASCEAKVPAPPPHRSHCACACAPSCAEPAFVPPARACPSLH